MRSYKKVHHIRHKTLKRKYGGTKEKQLNPYAESYIPDNKPLINTSEIKAMNDFIGIIENAVAIDCEMVGVGHGESALAHVAIVDFNGRCIYDKYVLPKGGIKTITDYRTKFSGITFAKLAHLDKRKHSFNLVKNEVHRILKNKIIVGHGLINDFKVLEYRPELNKVWNTTTIEQFQKNHPHIPGLKQPRKLKVIAKEFANNNIQLDTTTGHSPLEDARASMNLYRISFGYPKIIYSNMSSNL